MNKQSFAAMECWTLSFKLRKGACGSVVRAVDLGKETVNVAVDEGKLSVSFRTYAKDSPLKLCCDVGDNAAAWITWQGHTVQLAIDGVIQDEDWPIGECFKGETIELRYDDSCVSELSFGDAKPVAEKLCTFANMQYWNPEGCRVGDCMPYFDGETFRLYYLKDRHGHASKWGLGAHQFAQATSRDLINWQTQPLAVPITHQWEGSICTGCVIQKDGEYYAFYAARMSDYTAARLTYAKSSDGISFTKSERYITLQPPYEPTSARDPHVFLGADGQYHMLVTTELCDVEQRNGCLAHLTSSDLENWEQQSPFYVPGYTDQPECSTYFEWNGWYYLCFSNYGVAKYRYSREPFGNWIKPRNDIFDSLTYRVPKFTSYHGNRRIAAGFLTYDCRGDTYAGSAIFRELIQNSDGTLSMKHLPEMLPQPCGKSASVSVAADSVNAFAVKPLLELDGGTTRIDLEITPSGENVCYGLQLWSGYEIRFEPYKEKVGVCPLNYALILESERTSIYNVPNLNEKVKATIILHGNIIDICVNDSRTLIARAERDVCAGVVSAYAKDGSAVFELA